MARCPEARPDPGHRRRGLLPRRRPLAQVLKQAVGPDTQESVQVLYGDEAKWEDVLRAARAGSLFAASRAVVVRRAELLKYASAPQDDEAPADAKGRGKGRSDEDPVDAYAEAPAPDATLVLVAAKPDKRRRPWKSLLAKAVVHDAAPRKGRALRSHVEQELRTSGPALHARRARPAARGGRAGPEAPDGRGRQARGLGGRARRRSRARTWRACSATAWASRSTC